MGYIYLVTNKINGMKYVGQSIVQDIRKRWNQHKIAEGRSIGKFLKSAYAKYGFDNFKFQIICICFDEDCNKYEEEYIKKFNTMAPNGYNLREGGKNSKLSEATKQLQREATTRLMENSERRKKSGKSGTEHPNYGKKYTSEQKEALRKKNKEYWANISPEKKKQISENRKAMYKQKGLTDKQYAGLQIGRELMKARKKIKAAPKRKCVRKSIGKYDTTNTLLEKYDSAADAFRKTGICARTILKVCAQEKGCNTAGGFIWKYL